MVVSGASEGAGGELIGAPLNEGGEGVGEEVCVLFHRLWGKNELKGRSSSEEEVVIGPESASREGIEERGLFWGDQGEL